MKIFVDACPVVRIVEEVAEKYRIDCFWLGVVPLFLTYRGK